MCNTPDLSSSEERTRLTSYYQTISDQLNGRLSESPRFFGVAVLAGTGYGFVLWKWSKNLMGSAIFVTSSLAFYLTLLWGIWYLLALGCKLPSI